MRSAATGLGKTRTMIADACTFACDTIFDLTEYKWVSNGTKEPTVYITTEQDKKEIQSMMLAFVSAVDEEHILTGKYENDEYERVKYAAKILQDSPLYIEMLPDFSMQDIENCIKRNIQLKNVKYICYDYIHTSMKILSEISSKTGVKGLREDNILFMIGVRLKDIAMQYGVFIITSTQLNGGYVEAKVFDQNLLRGAKSLGDKIDVGMIMLRVEEEEKEALGPIIRKGGFEMPDIKISVYKNRRSRYEHILIWCKSNRGICRIDPLFVTGYNYDFIPIEDTQIKVVESSN
jgi:replicative DNA helicase